MRALRDLVAASLSTPVQEVMQQQANTGLMVRVRRYIHSNLHSPDLTPDALARELGISRTRLYQLFAASGGVLQYVRNRRLAAAHAALSDPANTQRILEIAQTAGFDSPASFSRAFSQAYGYSPREARRAPIQAIPQTEQEGSASFKKWLVALGR